VRYIFIVCLALITSACGFHLQGEEPLAPALHSMYLQSPDPYGHLAQNLKRYLKMSHVQLASSPSEAKTVLAILSDTNTQRLLGVSGTQQTRQYQLAVTVTFEITDKAGRPITSPQTLNETRAITVQSDQILGSSNEANLYYQQMRRTLAYSIINTLSSKQVTATINHAFPTKSS